MSEIIVEIPSCTEHAGYPGNVMRVALPEKCQCGGTRAVNITRGRSYDGSRFLYVDMWSNSCGCIDTYRLCRQWVTEGYARQVPHDTETTYVFRRLNGEAQHEADHPIN